MGILKKHSDRPIDHIKNIFLMEVQNHNNGESEISLTFAQNAGYEVVSYERLKEIYELLGQTLKIGEKNYKEFKEWYDKQPIED